MEQKIWHATPLGNSQWREREVRVTRLVRAVVAVVAVVLAVPMEAVALWPVVVAVVAPVVAAVAVVARYGVVALLVDGLAVRLAVLVAGKWRGERRAGKDPTERGHAGRDHRDPHSAAGWAVSAWSFPAPRWWRRPHVLQ